MLAAEVTSDKLNNYVEIGHINGSCVPAWPKRESPAQRGQVAVYGRLAECSWQTMR
jgi:hypothetical protein